MSVKLSICIPTYKRVDCLISLVNSIPEKYPVCISDNGNYVNDTFFKRRNIKISHHKDVVHMFANWNRAISLVDTDWFILPGDDDILFIDVLDEVVSYIEKYSDCAYLAFEYDNIDNNGGRTQGWRTEKERYLIPPKSFDYVAKGCPFSWPAIVINTKKSREIGNFDEEFKFTASDNLYLQSLAIQYPIALINKVLGGNRIWNNSTAVNKISSREWFEQCKLWQSKLNMLLVNKEYNTANIEQINDYVIYDNLCAALTYISSYKERLDLLLYVGWPKSIGIKNHLRLIKFLIFPKHDV